MEAPITRSECLHKEGVMAKKMEKLEEKFDSLRLDVAQLPEKLIEKLDQRYASKQSEELVCQLRDKLEERNYEWLKYLITALIGAVISALLIKFK